MTNVVSGSEKQAGMREWIGLEVLAYQIPAPHLATCR
jgi:hypothetical protein